MKKLMLLLGVVFVVGCAPSREAVLYTEVQNCSRSGATGAAVNIERYTPKGHTRQYVVYNVTCVGQYHE